MIGAVPPDAYLADGEWAACLLAGDASPTSGGVGPRPRTGCPTLLHVTGGVTRRSPWHEAESKRRTVT